MRLPRAVEELAQRKQVKAAIDQVKAAECARCAAEVAALVREKRHRGGGDFAELTRALRPLLEGPDGIPS